MARTPCDPIDCYEIVESIVLYAGYEPAYDAIAVPVSVTLMPTIHDECECPGEEFATLYVTDYYRPCTKAFTVPVRRRICQGLRLDPLTCEEAVEALKRGL
jgi:hypothetical protein